VAGGHLVLLGDVTGMGVTAAALTSLVRHTARAAAAFDPGVLEHVNNALRRRPQIAPVTMVCGLLERGAISLAVGGHPLPLLKRVNGACAKVGASGLLLGAVEDYAGGGEVTIAPDAGDTLLLYTDGVTDTPGDDGRFGEARLCRAIDAAPAEPRTLLRAASATLDAFAHGDRLDDRAMLALQRR